MKERKIQAKDLKVGQWLHLRFMGGDEFVKVEKVKVTEKNVLWEGSNFVVATGGIIEPDKELQIKDAM